jgi:N-acetyltransferase
MMTDPFDFQPTLHGEWLTMRPYAEDDFEALYAVAADPLIWEVHPVPERHQRPVFRFNIDDALSDKGGLVAIDRNSGAIIGYSRYSQTKVDAADMEIGWTFLARAFWGGQYNRDMKRVMLAHALASFERVIFRVGDANGRSRRAVEKIGGVLIPWDEVISVFGRDIRHVAYEITREGFAKGPLA